MSAPHDSVSSTVASTLSLEALTQLLEKIFLRHGTSASVARILAANCAGAERDGAHSHGVFRIPGYVSTLNSGWVNGQAVPQVEDVAPGFVRVDAGNGDARVLVANALQVAISGADSGQHPLRGGPADGLLQGDMGGDMDDLQPLGVENRAGQSGGIFHRSFDDFSGFVECNIDKRCVFVFLLLNK